MLGRPPLRPMDGIEASEVPEEASLLEYEELCNEVLELQAELRAGKIEVQQLRLRLFSASKSSASGAGAGTPCRAGGTSSARAPAPLQVAGWHR